MHTNEMSMEQAIRHDGPELRKLTDVFGQGCLVNPKTREEMFDLAAQVMDHVSLTASVSAIEYGGDLIFGAMSHGDLLSCIKPDRKVAAREATFFYLHFDVMNDTMEIRLPANTRNVCESMKLLDLLQPGGRMHHLTAWDA